MEILKIAAAIISSFGVSSLIILGFSNWLGKIWANRIMESEKAKYARDLDSIRHQFNLEQQKLSIVYENQKNSFKIVIQAMYDVIRALEQPYGIPWEPLKHEYYYNFEKIIINESLFIGAECERALNIFLGIIYNTLYFPDTGSHPKDHELGQSYSQLKFISECIREFFRKQVGLSENKDTLLDVELLDACLFIKAYHKLYRGDSSNEFIISLEKDQSPLEIICLAKNNIRLLKDELSHFIEYTKSKNQYGSWFFKKMRIFNYYLKKFHELNDNIQ